MSDTPLKFTSRAYLDDEYDSSRFEITASSPEELETRIRGVATSGVFAAAAEFKLRLSGATEVPQPAAPQQQAWGNQATPQQAPQQQSQTAQQGGWNNQQATFHPEGKQCQQCGNVLEYKKTQSGKPKWQCADWRWNNGTPNNHAMEWAN